MITLLVLFSWLCVLLLSRFRENWPPRKLASLKFVGVENWPPSSLLMIVEISENF